MGKEIIQFSEKLIKRSCTKINEDDIVSSWKDSLISGRFKGNLAHYLKVPKKDCFIDRRKMEIENRDFTIERIWSIGGETGWYYGDWLWSLRGLQDCYL